MEVVVGIADMKVAKGPGVTLVTHALGSCLGVCIYDPQAKVGGLLHCMLPEAKASPAKAKAKPYMFSDLGIPLLFKQSYALGAKKNNLIVRLIGCAEVANKSNVLNIGKRNYIVAKRLFFKNNIVVKAEEIGGTTHRTVRMDLATGEVQVKVKGGGITTI